jgi:hypothetical protein
VPAIAGITEPEELVFKREEVMPEIASPVVVADVPVAVVKVKDERVEEAGARKPLRKARVVEVACSLVESLVNGKLNPGEDESVPLVNERLLPMVRGTRAPLGEAYGIWDDSEVTASLVVVAADVVALTAVKFCRVVEPTTNNSPAPLNDEVAVAPKKALPALKTVVLA